MVMNREMRRASEREGRRLQKYKWSEFKDVTEEAIQKHLYFDPESKFSPDYVFQNNKYIVMCFKNSWRKGNYYTKVMCRRSDSAPIYSWNDLYRIKNEIFGEEIEAVQFMPKKSELVDDANLYWFWIEGNSKLVGLDKALEKIKDGHE